jgi:hypothetical protein
VIQTTLYFVVIFSLCVGVMPLFGMDLAVALLVVICIELDLYKLDELP